MITPGLDSTNDKKFDMIGTTITTTAVERMATQRSVLFAHNSCQPVFSILAISVGW